MYLKIISITLLLAIANQAEAKQKETDVWTEGNRVAASVELPKITNTEYLITNYGASPDSAALHNGNAINKAIDDASCKGGGKVIIPAGIWLTGPIDLKSGVNLVLSKGAVLKFSTIHEHYLPVVRTRWEGIDCYNLHPLIYAYKQTDIAITGEGTIDGQGSVETWWHWCGSAKKYGWKEGMLRQNAPGHGRVKLTEYEQTGVDIEQRRMGIADALRPQLINIFDCERVLIENVTLKNSPFWVIHPVWVNHLTVRGVNISSHGPNSDGCDPESSKNVLIENCVFDTGDDCIAIKSGRNNDGRLWNRPSENIVVRNCKMKDGHGGIVVGSEITGGYRNLWIENCQMDSPELERVVRIKTNPCRGGVIENIFVRNITVGQCKEAVLKINLDYEPREACKRDFPPIVRNVFVENVTSQKSKYGIFIIGLADTENIENVVVRNCDWNGVEKGNRIDGKVGEITFSNYKQNGEKMKNPKR